MKNLLFVILFSLASTQVLADTLGKTTYELACKKCHAPEMSKAIKAPAAFDKKAWDGRFQKASLEAKNNPNRYKTPIDYLLYSVTIGKGLMYHGGLCKEAGTSDKNCTDKALIDAIHYMSSN